MLYDQARKYILRNGKIVKHGHPLIGAGTIRNHSDPAHPLRGYGKDWAENYDYTDKGFQAHLARVYDNLRAGGVEGIFFDYPSYAFPRRGGLADRYATAYKAYSNVFRIPREKLGPRAYLQERLGVGSDGPLAYVNSVRIAGDTNRLKNDLVYSAAMRWYKNRRLTNYDMDGKALLEIVGPGGRREIGTRERRAILTVCYAVTGRLLLTESFRRFTPQVLFDLGRVFPFHGTTLSARPLNAFLKFKKGDTLSPWVFDFPVSPPVAPGRPLQRPQHRTGGGPAPFGRYRLRRPGSGGGGGNTTSSISGTTGFSAGCRGKAVFRHSLAPGEARMISVHAVEKRPQWLSTNRHIMQGYVDLVKKPVWDPDRKTLSATSRVVGGEAYRVTIALNGYEVEGATARGGTARFNLRPGEEGPGRPGSRDGGERGCLVGDHLPEVEWFMGRMACPARG